MGLLQGALLTGAAATGLVVAERVRHRGSGEDVRADVVEFGTSLANQVGKAAGFVGHTGGTVLGKSSELADGLGDRASQVVTGVGRTIARGAGATMGAYAGAIDRVVPKIGRGEPSKAAASTATSQRTKSTAKRTRARATSS